MTNLIFEIVIAALAVWLLGGYYVYPLFLSKAAKSKRAMADFRKWLLHRLHIDEDIMSAANKKKMDEIILESDSINSSSPEKCAAFMEKARERALKLLPAPKWPRITEYLDIIAVACMVAFGVRALYLQPFKIPTSSMQPTLFGIHYMDKDALPKLPAPIEYAVFSARKAELTVQKEGYADPRSVSTRTDFLILDKTSFDIGGVQYTLPGDLKNILNYTGLGRMDPFMAGQKVCDGWLSLGDHLFVDRFSHHFTDMRRGDVVVFNTVGIVCNGQRLADNGYYYIKRLVGLPGDEITFRKGMVYIKPAGEDKEKPLTELSKAFDKVYSMKGGYQGHSCPPGAHWPSALNETFKVPKDCYYVLGDNTGASSDSRYWGFVPRENIVGKGFCVFWPFGRRWGLVDHEGPLDVPTDSGMKVMTLQ
jgi:signal peptidase I